MNQTTMPARRATQEKKNGLRNEFSGKMGLRNSILTTIGVFAASFFLSVSPAQAEDAKCSARVVSGDRGESHSLKLNGTKVDSLTLRFLTPKRGMFFEVRFPGQFVEGLVGRPEDEVSFVLGRNHGKAMQLMGYRKAVSFDCILPTATSPATKTAPAEPQVDMRKLLSTAHARGKELFSMSKQSGVTSKSAGAARALVGKRGELTRAAKSRDAEKLALAIEQADMLLEAMTKEREDAANAVKSEALDLLAQLREQLSKLPDGRQKTAATKTADSLESESKREPLVLGALSGRMREAQSAIVKSRDVIESAEAARTKAAEDRAKAAASDDGMRRCSGSFPVRVQSGKGAIAGYPIEVPLRLRVESKILPGAKSGTMYELVAELKLTALDLTSDRIESTVDKATKTVRSELFERCPAADDKVLTQVSSKVRGNVLQTRNRTIEQLDLLIGSGETEGLDTLMKVRELVAGSSKAAEEARKAKATEKVERSKRKLR